MKPVLSYRHAGFTLIELMVSITLSLIVLLAITTLFVSNQQTLLTQSGSAHMQDNGGIALSVLGRLLKDAGYCDVQSYTTTDASGNWVVPCNHVTMDASTTATDTSFYAPVSIEVLAVQPIASASSSFLLDNGSTVSLASMGQYSDRLTIRYLTGPQASSGYAMPDCLGNPSPAGANVLVSNTFYIKVVGVGSGNAPHVLRPQLYCDVSWTDLDGKPLPAAQTSVLASSGVVAENIERLKVLYGVDSTGSGETDNYVAASGVASKAYSVRVAMLARQDPVFGMKRAELYGGAAFNLFGSQYGMATASSDSSWVQPLASTTVACSQNQPCWARKIYDQTFNLRNRAP